MFLSGSVNGIVHFFGCRAGTGSNISGSGSGFQTGVGLGLCKIWLEPIGLGKFAIYAKNL